MFIQVHKYMGGGGGGGGWGGGALTVVTDTFIQLHKDMSTLRLLNS